MAEDWEKTVLTDEEIITAINDGSTIGGTLISMNENFAKQMRAVSLASQKATVKAIGKWLASRERKVDSIEGQISRGFLITEKDIEALKQGKFPGENNTG